MAGFIREQIVKRITRSSGWNKLRSITVEQHGECAACGRKSGLQVHHKEPFHLKPELELMPNNLIVFCGDCHLLIGHLMWFKSYNPNVEADAKTWREKIEARP